jgi:hypothetical protein
MVLLHAIGSLEKRNRLTSKNIAADPPMGSREAAFRARIIYNTEPWRHCLDDIASALALTPWLSSAEAVCDEKAKMKVAALEDIAMKILFVAVAVLIGGRAVAAEERHSPPQLLSTLSCVMLAQKHVAAAALVEARAPRKDAVMALAVTKLPNQTPQEALRDAEQILEFVGGLPSLNPDQLGDEKFAGCAKEKALPMTGALAPKCWRLLPLMNEVMTGRKRDVAKSQALKGVKNAKGIEGLKSLDWNAMVDRAYKWEGSPSEFTVGEVIRCGQTR